MNEIWKDIEGYEGLYQVSNLGRVKSLQRKIKCFSTYRTIRESILKNQNWGDYQTVNLRKEGIAKIFKIHRLVAIHFIPNPENKPEVNHIDGDKYNNMVENLEWLTTSENGKHSYNTGLSKRGSENRKADKLTEEDVRVIKQMIKDGIKPSKIHEKFKYVVEKTAIYSIKYGKSWKNVKL